MALVVDASVGLKWALREPDSRLAEALLLSAEELLVPDFWLTEATNILWPKSIGRERRNAHRGRPLRLTAASASSRGR